MYFFWILMLIEIKFTKHDLIRIQKLLELDERPLTTGEIRDLIRRLIQHKYLMI